VGAVYCIKCKITGAMYIGSAVDLSKRIAEHFLYGKSNEHLQRALALYGLDNFEFLIVEFCTPELLIEREQYYLNWFSLFFETACK